MPRITVDGLSVHYQQAGHGPDMVLVHGLGADLSSWFWGAMPLLAKTFRVTAYDLRGHGLTQRTPGGYTTAQLAADLDALLRQLGIEYAHLIGHSYGAAVVLHQAALRPHAATSVTVADGYLPCFEPRRAPRRSRRQRRAADRLRVRGVAVPEHLPRIALGFLEDLAAITRPAERTINPIGVAVPDLATMVARWRRLLAMTSIVPDMWDRGLSATTLATVAAPVLGVYGQRSTCKASLQGLRAALPQMGVILAPGVGHLHAVLSPQTLVAGAEQFANGGAVSCCDESVTSTGCYGSHE